MDALVKIVFLLEQEEGYPPVSRESVWAKRLHENRYQIDNIPFYIREISHNDIVETKTIGGEIRFKQLLEQSGASTFRLLLIDPSTSGQVRDALKQLGCESEYNKEMGLIAVEIPKNVPIQPFLRYAMIEQKKGALDIEEGALRHGILDE